MRRIAMLLMAGALGALAGCGGEPEVPPEQPPGSTLGLAERVLASFEAGTFETLDLVLPRQEDLRWHREQLDEEGRLALDTDVKRAGGPAAWLQDLRGRVRASWDVTREAGAAAFQGADPAIHAMDRGATKLRTNRQGLTEGEVRFLARAASQTVAIELESVLHGPRGWLLLGEIHWAGPVGAAQGSGVHVPHARVLGCDDESHHDHWCDGEHDEH